MEYESFKKYQFDSEIGLKQILPLCVRVDLEKRTLKEYLLSISSLVKEKLCIFARIEEMSFNNLHLQKQYFLCK